jgi:hypothetical protein
LEPGQSEDELEPIPIVSRAVLFDGHGGGSPGDSHFTFTPVHSNRQSVRSVGSLSVDEVKDEPAQVRTETVRPLEAEAAVLATTPPPMAAIKVRSFRVEPGQPSAHAAAIAAAAQLPRQQQQQPQPEQPQQQQQPQQQAQQPQQHQVGVATTARLETPVAMVASKHALSSASVTFQELRRRPVSMRSEESDVLHELLMRGSLDSSSTGVFQDSDYEAGDEGEGRRQGWQGLPSPSSAASVPNSVMSVDIPFEVVRLHALSSSVEHTNTRPEVCRSNDSVVTDSPVALGTTAAGATRVNVPSEGDIEDNLDANSEVASDVYTLVDPSAEQPWAHHPAVKRNSKTSHRTTRGSSSARNSRHSRVQDDDSTEDDDAHTPHERKSRREHRTSGTRVNSFRDSVASPKMINTMLQEESDRGNDGDVSEIYRLESPSKSLSREAKHPSSTSAVEYDSPSSSDKSSLAASPRRLVPTASMPAPPTGLAWKLDDSSKAPAKSRTMSHQQLNTSTYVCCVCLLVCLY